jgi:uncharacterized protein
MSTKVLKTKHVPMRTCIITRKKLPKSELIRLVLTSEDKIVVDLKGKQRGRGANITPEKELIQKALKNKIIEKALKLNRVLSEEEKQNLINDFVSAVEEKSFRPNNKAVTIKVSKDKLNMASSSNG